MFGKLDLVKLTKKRKVIGRGGKCGKSSGRGRGGQLSRAGGRSKISVFFEGGQMPLSRRIPVRGFTQINKKEYEVVGLEQLEDRFDDKAVIDIEALRGCGLLRTSLPVKVLANGLVTKSFTLKINAISASAKSLVEGKGGAVVLV